MVLAGLAPVSRAIAAAMPEYQSRPGWTEVNLDDSPLQVASDDHGIAMLVSDGIALLDSRDGTVREKITPPRGVLGNSAVIRMENGLLYVAALLGDAVVLDVYDPASGIWRSATAPGNPGEAYGQVRALGRCRTEVRVMLSTGRLYRWNFSDLSQLPSYAIDSVSTPIATAMGQDYCLGVSSNQKGLLMERNGGMVVLAFPKGYTAHDKFASSEDYLVVAVERWANETFQSGVLIWNKRLPATPPVYLSIPTFYAERSLSIWNNRFLLIPQTRVNVQADRLLRVIDLAKPADVPLIIPFPAGTQTAMAQGILNGDYWTVQFNPGAIVSSPAQFHRFPIFASGTKLMATVSDAKGDERGGVLRFRVATDRAVVAPVTVHLKTRSGSAAEGADYVKWEGSVVLTAAKPSANVDVPIVDDSVLETHESMILEVVSVEGAWRERPFATGVISGSGFKSIMELSMPPGSGDGNNLYTDLAMTDAGVLAMAGVNANEYGFFLCRPGTRTWERVVNLGAYPKVGQDSGSCIRDVLGTNVCIAMPRADSSMNGTTFVVVDLASGQLIASVPGFTRKGLLHRNGLLAPVPPTGRVTFTPFTDGDLPWELAGSSGWSSSFSRYPDDRFVYSESGSSYSIRNFVDGSQSGPFPNVEISMSKGRFWFGQRKLAENDYFVVANGGPDGYPFLTVAGASTGEVQGEISDDGLLFCNGEPEGPDVRTRVVDCTTGALLKELPGIRTYRPRSWANGVLAGFTSAGKLRLIRTAAVLPEPSQKSFAQPESVVPGEWNVDFGERADFPTQLRVISASSDVIALDPVVVPAGARSARFPAAVVSDGIPENDEIATVTLEVSGRGYVETYPISIKIPANDSVYLKGEPDAIIAKGSSVALHPSGTLVGSSKYGSVADIRHERLHAKPPKSLSQGTYAYALACDGRYAVVGAPVLSSYYSKSYSSVFIYERKKGKLVREVKEPAINSAFGAVLKLSGDWLLVGAPGAYKTKGFARAYALGGKLETTFIQPGAGRGEGFGTSIASDGTSVWIGAPRAGAGKIYQFSMKSGKLIRELLPPSGAGARNFGQSIALAGSTVAVGAPAANGNAAVYFYDLNSGKQAGVISTPFSDGGYFGAELSLVNKRVLAVGCPKSAFAPEGGVILYELRGADRRFINMLRPPRPTGKYHNLFGFGMTGRMSASDGFMAVVAGGAGDPLDILGMKSTHEMTGRPLYLGIFNLTPYLPVRTSNSPALLTLTDAGSVWERAAGPGASAGDFQVSVTCDGLATCVKLPQVDRLQSGSLLVVERSTNLSLWVQVASANGDDNLGWVPSVNGGSTKLDSLQLQFPAADGGEFFRIRCEVR